MTDDAEAPEEAETDGAGTGAEPDVFLDVPDLHLDELQLEVEGLRARVSLRAEVLDLLKINVGADVALERVSLDIKGVGAKARLTVQLNEVAAMVERVLETIDRNPEVLRQVVGTAESAVQETGATAREGVGKLGGSPGKAIEGVARSAKESGSSLVQRAGDAVGMASADAGRTAGEASGSAGEEASDAASEASGRGERRNREPRPREPRTRGRRTGERAQGAARRPKSSRRAAR